MAAPTLRRTLGLRSVVLFGLAYMTPLIVLGIFGVVAQATAGASPSAYTLALIAMLFTALSYGRMAAAYPVAGSAYTYVRRTMDGRAGFMVGWAVLLDYFFLPMVIWLIGGSYLSAQFPSVPSWLWIVGFVALTTGLNIAGIKVADLTNSLLMLFQILVLAFFVLLSVGYLVRGQGPDGLFDLTPFTGEGGTLSAIAAGAAIAAYSFLGFDAVTTLTEETIEPRRTIPRAILLVALIGGGIFIFISYVTQLVHPGGTFTDVDSAASEIAQTIGGSLFGAVFLAGLVVAQFTSGLAAQASATRLLYAMGRDSVLPRRLFGYLHPRLRTPVFSIVLTGAVGLIAIGMDVATSTSFINFGAFTAFTFVNLSVIAYYVRERRAGRVPGAVSHLAVPAAGAVVNVYLLTSLDGNAITLGLIWLAVGLAYLAYLTRLFRLPPPELDFSEREPDEEGAPAARG